MLAICRCCGAPYRPRNAAYSSAVTAVLRPQTHDLMTTRARSKNFLGSIGTRGFRVAICVRPERGNRIYFHLPRKKRSPHGSRGGSRKVASDLEYAVPGAERRKNEALAELRAAQIALALRAGASDEEIEEIARGGTSDAAVPDGQLSPEVPVAEDAAVPPAPIQAAPAAADLLSSYKRPAAVLPLADVLELAIGPSPRGDPRQGPCSSYGLLGGEPATEVGDLRLRLDASGAYSSRLGRRDRGYARR